MCKSHQKSGKFMALLLSVLLIFSMVPVQVFAEEIRADTANASASTSPDEKEPFEELQIAIKDSSAPKKPINVVAQKEITPVTGSQEPESDCLVVFDPDDGKTGYKDFYKVTVPVGGTVTDRPENPTRDGYFFKGWYSYLDNDLNPILWDFENDTVEDGNTTLWAAWEEGCIVAFDPDDGKTGYKDFYKVTIPVGGTVTDWPENPTRDGYLFKGWYSYLDNDLNPILWDFENDTVEDNITLWAAWEKGCIVAFDPDYDNIQYPDFYKVTVPVGGTVTDQPEKPVRDGYIFKGWYSYLDNDLNPILWDFENDTVGDNTTLWAAWEKGCIVAFDPDYDNIQYPDFYKVTVPVGGIVTDQPEKPIRDGYFFKGWYAFLDENDNPVFWDFETDTVEDNITLWAAWEEEANGGDTDGENGGGGNSGGGNSGGGNSGGGNTGGGNSGGGNSGGGNSGGGNSDGGNSGGGNSGGNSGGGNSGGNSGGGNTGGGNSGGQNGSGENNVGEEINGNDDGDDYTEIDDNEIPLGSLDLDDIPKTGDNSSEQSLLWLFCGVSASGVITLMVQRKKKATA